MNALAEAMRKEIVRQRDEASIGWLDADAFNEGETSVHLDGFLDLNALAKVVAEAAAAACEDAGPYVEALNLWKEDRSDDHIRAEAYSECAEIVRGLAPAGDRITNG